MTRAAIEGAIAWRDEHRVVNPDPGRGLASSLQVGFEAVPATAKAVLVALGDQPLVSAAVIEALLDGKADPARPVAMPTYDDERGRNPVLLRRAAFGLVAEACRRSRTRAGAVGAPGDGRPRCRSPAGTPTWIPGTTSPTSSRRRGAQRVRANREQVERIREVPDGADFYAPVNSLFRADPTRGDDPVLAALLELVRSGDTWLDVGAGAGRFALPIARALDPSGGSVVALDASPSMLEGLLEIAEDYAIENVRTVHSRWPPADPSEGGVYEADVALIAHVGYDIEAIGPFIDALEAAASRICVAVLMQRVPASAADPFWPPVHGETRVGLPALPDLLELLEARGRRPRVTMVTRRPAPVRDARRPGGVHPPPALDRPGRTEGGAVPGGARRADGPGRRRLGDQGTRAERCRGGHLDAGAAPRAMTDPIPVDAFLAGYPDEIRERAEVLRRVVRQAVPGVLERVRPGWRIIGYDLPNRRSGAYFAWVMPESVHIHLGWVEGILLADPERMLEGAHLRLEEGTLLHDRTG